MDSLDKKSLHLLAGIKQPLNECMNTTAPMATVKTPATVQIMAHTGDEVAAMIQSLAAMSRKNHQPEHVSGDHIDRSQMVNVPRMSDLMSKIDQYEEIKDSAVVPYSNSPNEEDVSLGDFPGGLGQDNYSLGRAGDHLTNRKNERMVTPEGLMKEYRAYVNEGEYLSDPDNLSNLTNFIKQCAPGLGFTPEELDKIVKNNLMVKKGITLPDNSPLVDDVDGANVIDPQPPPAITRSAPDNSGEVGKYNSATGKFEVNVKPQSNIPVDVRPQSNIPVGVRPQSNIPVGVRPQSNIPVSVRPR
jgi:hypothetical protein